MQAHDTTYKSIPTLELRDERQVLGVALVVQSATFSFSVSAAGNTAVQALLGPNTLPLKPSHIGQYVGLPIAAYLCFHSLFATLDAVGASSTDGFLIYVGPDSREYTLCSYALVAAQFGALQIPDLGLVPAVPITERDTNSLGSLYVAVQSASGINTQFNVRLNIGVYYGLPSH